MSFPQPLPVRESSATHEGAEWIDGSLYRNVLGPAWFELHPTVQYFHHGRTPLEAVGEFQILHSNKMPVRLLARLLGLPPAAERVATRLSILPSTHEEIWSRRFGEHEFVTRQMLGSGRLLVERVGRSELRLRLSVVEHGIVYEQVGARLVVGPWSISLPSWMAPRVWAQELPSNDNPRRVQVQVRVTLPWVGELIRYNGYMEWEDERQ